MEGIRHNKHWEESDMRDTRIVHLEELVDAHIRHLESLKSELKELKEVLFWYADGNGVLNLLLESMLVRLFRI